MAMPEAQYASVVFPLMFWKYLSDTWEHRREEFQAENEGLDTLFTDEAHEIEYRDYQSLEIPFIYPQDRSAASRLLVVHPRHHH
ncbi:type I restriction-modification system subunit M N-terminal domain-containing protein, partial [Actinomadura sp. SCN-SB]|uniref:type I restriction-modification system subunit M N-terminal domain-containing protein n=1 Tax=Actinomadura sp. SCN-SB TaxID=3373092 RepID=UPI0037533576